MDIPYTYINSFAGLQDEIVKFGMTNKNFGNLFGSKVVRHGNKVVSCAAREQWDGSYSKYKSNMGKCAGIKTMFRSNYAKISINSISCIVYDSS